MAMRPDISHAAGGSGKAADAAKGIALPVDPTVPIQRGRTLDRQMLRHLSLEGKACLVVGLGRFGGGVGVTNWLARRGAHVTVTDMADGASLAASIKGVAEARPRLLLGGHDAVRPADYDLVVFNPAVRKPQSKLFSEVVEAGVPWTTEINLFCACCRVPIIGVTGTFGKSTTCAMLTHLLVEAGGYDVRFGGNIGVSLLSCLEDEAWNQDSDGGRRLVVLEISEAQLDDLPDLRWGPPTAVITNVVPHHLERYGEPAFYFARKMKIIHGGTTRRVLAGPMHPAAEAMFQSACAGLDVPVIRFHQEEEGPLPDYELPVPGRHNQINADVAMRVASHFGVSDDVGRRTLATFPGLAHRLEFVRDIDGVTYINDSKSTAPDATVAAVQSFARSIVLIVGGQSNRSTCDPAVVNAVREKCRTVIAMGEHGRLVASALHASQRDGTTIASTLVSSIEDACHRAREAAEPGDVVLFSPGGASFDTHHNYQQRGEAFCGIVNAW
ncbi:MAG: UDP-N-acetylmuramoyl-L-alanine--D-glutamate ligase [Phycisphaerae bacterium]